MLDDDVLAALAVKGADRVPARHAIAQKRVEIANAEFVGPDGQPAVENATQKLAVLLRRDRERGDLPGLRIDLDAWNELHVANAQVEQEIKDLVRVLGGEVVDQRQRVERHVVPLAAVDGPHDAVPRAMPAEVEPIAVVQLPGPVDADADEELGVVQEPAPFIVVEQNGIRLE